MSFILTIAVYTGRGTAVADAAALAQKCGPGLNNMWDAESKVKISTEERAMESHKMAMFETRTKQLEMLLGMPYLSDDERLRVQQELFKHVMGGLSMPSAKSNASTGRKRAASQALDGSDDDDLHAPQQQLSRLFAGSSWDARVRRAWAREWRLGWELRVRRGCGCWLGRDARVRRAWAREWRLGWELRGRRGCGCLLSGCWC